MTDWIREEFARERRAKAVLVALVRHHEGERLNRTILYKAFYLAHLVHMHRRGAALTDWPVVKMPRGPGVGRGPQILQALHAEGTLSERPGEWGPYSGFEYSVADRRRAEEYLSELHPAEIESIVEACRMIKDADGAGLSRWSHEVSRAWNKAKDGEELPIYADLSDDETAKDLGDRLKDAAFHLKNVL